MIDFERYKDGVIADVALDYGVTLRLVSEEPAGEREWLIDEIEFEPVYNTVEWRRNLVLNKESELHTAVDKAFAEWCRHETQHAHDAAPA